VPARVTRRTSLRPSRRVAQRPNGSLEWTSAWLDPSGDLSTEAVSGIVVMTNAYVSTFMSPTLVHAFVDLSGINTTQGTACQLAFGLITMPYTIDSVTDVPSPFTDGDASWAMHRTYGLVNTTDVNAPSNCFRESVEVSSARVLHETDELWLVFQMQNLNGAATPRFQAHFRGLIREK